MHFEILVEGQCELTTLSIIMAKIIGPYREPHTWKIHKHRGIGKIPEFPDRPANRDDPSLLHNLHHKLTAYGKEMGPEDAVIVLVDLDGRPDCRAFKQALIALLPVSSKKPRCLFRIAVEELEAWFLGDPAAVLKNNPHTKQQVLTDYIQDSQCGTWEKLADAIHPGGSVALTATDKRSRRVLEHKQSWAKKIAPEMDVEHNRSHSFQCFRDGVRNLASASPLG